MALNSTSVNSKRCISPTMTSKTLSSALINTFHPLSYACRFWDDHLKHTDFTTDLFRKVFKKTFLFWLGALSLTRNIGLALRNGPKQSTTLLALEYDLWSYSSTILRSVDARSKLDRTPPKKTAAKYNRNIVKRT